MLNEAAQRRGNHAPMVSTVQDEDLEAIRAELADATGLLPNMDLSDLRIHDALDLLGNPWLWLCVVNNYRSQHNPRWQGASLLFSADDSHYVFSSTCKEVVWGIKE